MDDRPTGTLLFAAIEGSTALWENHPKHMRAALARYHQVLQGAAEPVGGHVFEAAGDTWCASFASAPNALRAALEAQRAFFAEQWGESIDPPVRMALHTGAVEERDGGCSGAALERVGRLLRAAHGGQVLVSGATCGLVRDRLEEVDARAGLVELGEYRPGESILPERVYGLVAPDLPDEFPPLRTGGAEERYRIKDYLGGGGMALVFLAHDVELDQEVAYKRLLTRFAQDEEFVERFRREAKSAAQLRSHPNIVPIYDRGRTAEGTYYLIMEYLPGGTLNDLIRDKEGSLPAPEAVRLTIQVAQALQEAHERGIVHRDVKPQNVLLTEKGEAKLADFGIARAASSTTMTVTGQVAPYTPAYASPEQKNGRRVDGRSDLYSLGVVLYEMLTGTLPCDAEDSMAMQHAHGQLLPPKEINPDVPDRMNDITLRLLAGDPEERYPDAAALIEDLEKSLLPPEPGGEERTSSHVGRGLAKIPRIGGRRWLSAALALAGLAGLVVVIFLIVSVRQPSSPDDDVQLSSSSGDAVQPPNPGDIFQDDFSDTSKGWASPEGDEYGTVSDYASGGYRIYNAEPGSTRVAAAPAGTGRDAIVEVDASRVDGAPLRKRAVAGVVCRRTSDNYYKMGIRTNGTPYIKKSKDGEDTILAGDSSSRVFLKGGAANHIRGDCVGDTLTLYVNDQKLLEAQDAEFGSGKVGLFVSNSVDGLPAPDFLFDNFQVSTPP